MSSPKERFIQLLEEDLAQLRKTAAAWRELEKHGGRLETADGKVIATAAQMETGLRAGEAELQTLITEISK